MGEEENQREPGFPALKLPFLHIPTMHSPEHPSGRPSTPPLQTLASVPFKWEEQPGKPRPCTDIIPLQEPAKCLELPPCRILLTDLPPAKKLIGKTASPTTVLDGPYNVARPKFSSFRFFREGQESFDSGSSSASPEGLLHLLGSKKSSSGGLKAKGFFGKFRGGKREFDGASCRFSPSSIGSCDSDESCTGVTNGAGGKISRNGSFSSVSHAKSSPLWATIYEGLKQVVQWKSSRKSNKKGQD